MSQNRDGRAVLLEQRAPRIHEAGLLREAKVLHFVRANLLVGALGIPFDGIPGISRSGFKFLHTALRVLQENACHAVALDEHRRAFAPTLWTRKIRDNVPATSMAAPRPIASVEPRWFVGAHADVGGGCRSDLLAQIPLRWPIDKASSPGLSFRSVVAVDWTF